MLSYFYRLLKPKRLDELEVKWRAPGFLDDHYGSAPDVIMLEENSTGAVTDFTAELGKLLKKNQGNWVRKSAEGIS